MAKKTSILRNYIKASLRALAKAKDLYFKGVTECTGQVNFSGTGIMGLPAPPSSLHRSYSVSSDSSTRSFTRSSSTSSSRKSSVDVDVGRKMPATVSRSRSVAAIGRIDENEAYDGDVDANTMKSEFLFPRSRSYAVSSRRPYF
ncbi:uncharacterized protein LOC124919213 [Impatiens glandulifera]|uniref:uncharacterized protein LOC124919213 n=1 Tax=Impatiens glandulifera TaxID=253017 RepID=UPI001FB04D0D|nr:uncharacterized protein LOC124919213 [Impatiens glandulifera]